MATAPLPLHGPTGILIGSVEDWFAAAPPAKGRAHWKDGYSAKELAKAWFRTGIAAVPAEFEAMLASHPVRGDAVLVDAIAEFVTQFDHRGRGRHHDLLLVLASETVRLVVGVEAKVRERLDTTVLQKYKVGLARRGTKASGHRGPSGLPDRVDELVWRLFGRRRVADPAYNTLRYQLLTAVAGTLVEAKNRSADAAVVVVHDLRNRNSTSADRTLRDLSEFVAALGGAIERKFAPGMLCGPFAVHGGGMIPRDIPLYVACVRGAEA